MPRAAQGHAEPARVPAVCRGGAGAAGDGLPCEPAPLQLTGEVAVASAKIPSITAGLASFIVAPKSPGGDLMIKDRGQLFNHMARLARCTTAGGVGLVPSVFLDVAMGEDQALVAFSPTSQDYTDGRHHAERMRDRRQNQLGEAQARRHDLHPRWARYSIMGTYVTA